MRKKINSPMTQLAIKLAINNLERLKKQGENPNEVIKQSIMNSWKALYPVKNKQPDNAKPLPKYNEDTHFLCAYCRTPQPKSGREYGDKGEGCKPCIEKEGELKGKEFRDKWNKMSADERAAAIKRLEGFNFPIPGWMKQEKEAVKFIIEKEELK